ncbi:hypothetical protein B5P44_26280 [Mycobacterium sp. CBMA 213]|nr:hypothetical protein [Mycolicibacterium sp. CBMA 213]
MEHFTSTASKEFGVRGINVNNVALGPLVIKFSEGSGIYASVQVRLRRNIIPPRGHSPTASWLIPTPGDSRHF